MTDRTRPSGEHTDADEAPELHNSEQDDELDQAQTVAGEALAGEARDASPLDSLKVRRPGDLSEDSAQDLVDHMRDMKQSGRIDMSAFRGEPNMDDNEDMYGDENREDDLPGDGAR